MPKEGSNAFYRAFADRWYLDRANRDTYLARQAAADLLTSGHLYLPTKLVRGLDTPSLDGDAARKKYVDDLIALYLPLAGGAITGDITIAALKTIDGVDISVHAANAEAHHKLVGARVYNSAHIALANDTTVTLTFDSQRFDTDGIHSVSANTSRLTCVTAGKYLIIASVLIDGISAAGIRQFSILLKGATIIAFWSVPAVSGGNNYMEVATLYDLAVGDYVECSAYQNSGTTLYARASGNISPEFMMWRIGE